MIIKSHVFSTIIFLCFISSCTHMTPSVSNPNNEQQHTGKYGQFVVEISSMSSNELANELRQQQQNEIAKIDGSSEKIMLLSAFKKSPNHSPYRAKELLNKFMKNKDKYSQHDLAILTILREQLNQQLRLHQKVMQELSKDEERQQYQNVVEQKLVEMQQQIKRLNTQITQLKNIEQSIDNQGTDE